MIQLDTITEFLSEYGSIFMKGNNIGMRCPLCGDSKKSARKRRFSVTYENGSAFYNCFNCGRSGTFAELVSELKGISISEAIKSVETVEFEDIKKTLTPQLTAVKHFEPTETLDFNCILESCLSVDSDVTNYFDKQYKDKLIQFIKDRKIPFEYNVFVANKGGYKGRYIIPIYHWGDIVYFQGRAIFDDADLKFKNPEVEKSGIIMNIDYFKPEYYIIVTEGIIDAMMVEYHQGTPVLGGSVSDDLLTELYKHTDKGIIIAVDNDERGDKEREKLLNSKYGKMLKYYITPHGIKDLNELKIKMNIPNMYDEVCSKSMDAFTLAVLQNII